MDPSYRPVSTMDWDEVVDVFNAAYAGYIVPLSMTADDLRHRCIAEDTSLDRSVVVKCDGENAGIALVGLRGDRARLAALGFVPAWRRRGLGRVVLRHLFAAVPEVARWELEVIEQNVAALRLYEETGFRVVDRLHGYERPPTADEVRRPLQRVTVAQVAERMSGVSTEDLPWQLALRTLARLREPWFGVHDGAGGHAFVNPDPEDALMLRWYFDDGTADIVRAVATQYAPTRPIRIVPLVPSTHDASLRRLGFVPMSINQLRMVREARQD